MKNLLLLFVLLNFGFVSAQKDAIVKKKVSINHAKHLYFEKNDTKLTKDDIETLNNIGNFILADIDKKYLYRFEVIPSLKDQENIEYKRVKIIINYLKDNFEIEKSKIIFQFFDSVPVDSFINFSMAEND